jgi:hypothetical protein
MNIEITIPETWSEVKLKQYLDYMKGIKPYEGTEHYELVLLEKAVNHFCNISASQLNALPIENYKGLIGYMTDLLKDGESQPLVKKFAVGGTKYGFIPSLDGMTYGEYLDLTTYFKDMWPNMVTIMSILYRPITEEKGETYSIQPYNGTDEETEALFSHALTMDIVWGAIGFFTLLQKDLSIGMMDYSMKTLEEMIKKDSQLQETLEKNGVDMSALQSLQEMISRDLNK